MSTSLLHKKLVIAADIGASSGRIIAGYQDNQRLCIEEIYRFTNGFIEDKGSFVWDLDALISNIVHGLRLSSQYTIASIGFDTWGVDYVLLDAQGNLLDKPYAYRDHRTDDTFLSTIEEWGREYIYDITGVQFLPFNTLYQFRAHIDQHPEAFQKAAHILLLSDYLHYRFSGKVSNEFTNATTTQLMHHATKDYDSALLAKLGIPKEKFPPMVMSGTILGTLTSEMQRKTTLPQDVKIITPCTHDTASGVVAFIGEEHSVFIISGTWSIMGLETTAPVVSSKGRTYNVSNEGGVYGSNILLKNIMGLWICNSIQAECAKDMAIEQIVEDTEKEPQFATIVNPNSLRFFNPDSMVKAIQDYAVQTQQSVPHTLTELMRCAYDSLGLLYNKVLEELEELTGRTFTRIHIIGGGCKNAMLNQLTADITQRQVIAGPVEASSVGNIAVQMMSLGWITDLHEARRIITHSDVPLTYTPRAIGDITDVKGRFETLYMRERN